MEAAAAANLVPPIPANPQQGAHTGRRGNNDARRGGQRSERGRGGQQRGRGRGPRRRTNSMEQRPRNADDATVLNATKESRSTTELPVQSNGTEHAVVEGGEVEAEVCFICASAVVHNSVAPCNHRTCHICALRLRALYKSKACAHCRSSAEFVIFTDDPSKRYEDFTSADFAKTDGNLGINYEALEIFEDTVLLLRYNCPDPSCDVACYGWPDLHRHVKGVHHKVMCDLCTRNKKVFTHEHELFTQQELRKHEKFGDDNPGAVDQSGFKGHPECGFCRLRFYGDDELYTHCRDKHERCHICDRRQSDQQPRYYLDYSALESHFRKAHFLCLDQECLDKKFVVFESEMDLKGHQLEVHPNGLSKDARRDARRVDMSGFDYRAAHQEPRRGNREGRGRGRGRDPNTDALPVSSAQPLRRDELAFQRQMAIHSAQSLSNRSFGSQLTSNDAFAARPPQGTSAPSTATAQREGTPSNSSAATPAARAASAPPPTLLPDLALSPAQNASPQDRARQLRHASVLERASNLLGNNPSSVASFRQHVSRYNQAQISAAQLVDALLALFDAAAPADLGTLVKELADIFEGDAGRARRDELLSAWRDWRAINDDYPSLPAADGGAAPASLAGSSGKRILKLKSSTAQSSRSNISRTGSWGSAAFPPIASASSSSAHQQQVKKAPAWVPAHSASSAPSSARASPAPSRPSSTRPANSTAAHASGSTSGTAGAGAGVGYGAQAGRGRAAAEAFPALPAAQKPGMNVSRPGYAGNPVIRAPPASVNAWASFGAAGASGTPPPTAAGGGGGDDGVEAGKKAKKGRGKDKVLFHWG